MKEFETKKYIRKITCIHCNNKIWMLCFNERINVRSRCIIKYISIHKTYTAFRHARVHISNSHGSLPAWQLVYAYSANESRSISPGTPRVRTHDLICWKLLPFQPFTCISSRMCNHSYLLQAKYNLFQALWTVIILFFTIFIYSNNHVTIQNKVIMWLSHITLS